MSLLDSPTPTTFRYQMGSDPGQPLGQQNADPGTDQYAEYWRVRRLVVENNVIELTPSLPLGFAPSTGIFLDDYKQLTSLYLYLQTVIRGNVIRALNDVPDSLSIGINLIKCEIAITEQNVIDPAVGTPIVQSLSGSFPNRCFSPSVDH